MRLAFIALAALGAAAVGTAALAAKDARESPLGPPPPDGGRLERGDCIRSREIRNHTIADNQTILLNVDGRSTYRVTVSGACLGGAVSSDPIVTRNPPGSSLICRPIDMDLAIAKDGFESTCIVRSIVKMTPEQVAALPKKLRP